MSDIAVIGAGVSGLTCGVLLAEGGERVTIFADETGTSTTSAAAGAIWYPYDAEPIEKVVGWSLRTCAVLRLLAQTAGAGVSMIELRCFTRACAIDLPGWSANLGARRLTSADCGAHGFVSGFALDVPLIDTSIYLPWLAHRFARAGGELRGNVRLDRLDDVPATHTTIVNCAGVGAATLVPDPEVEPHRGQVVLVTKRPLAYALVCDDPPLMYIFPRTNDCVFGGTNDVSHERAANAADTAAILQECSRVLRISPPPVLTTRVGLRPFRRSGVRLEREQLPDGRSVIHNYGHGGSGFTLSWGCAEEVAAKIERC